jgi:threonine dehydrogenase-like Zn-dependent dehydrogenase
LLSVAILRTLYPAARVAIVARYPHQAEAAHRLGAHKVITARSSAQVVEAVADLASVRVLRPTNGLPWLLRGADAVYDTVGSPETLTVDVRVASARAPVVIAGVGVPARWEWTPHYFKEVVLIGSNAFGVEELDGIRMHAMAHYLRLAAQGRFDLSPLITHRFHLDEFAQAFAVLHAKGRHRAVKGVFDFRAE